MTTTINLTEARLNEMTRDLVFSLAERGTKPRALLWSIRCKLVWPESMSPADHAWQIAVITPALQDPGKDLVARLKAALASDLRSTRPVFGPEGWQVVVKLIGIADAP